MHIFRRLEFRMFSTNCFPKKINICDLWRDFTRIIQSKHWKITMKQQTMTMRKFKRSTKNCIVVGTTLLIYRIWLFYVFTFLRGVTNALYFCFMLTHGYVLIQRDKNQQTIAFTCTAVIFFVFHLVKLFRFLRHLSE